MRQVLMTGKFLSLIREGHWEYVDRVNASGAAIIVAVTPENKLLMVEQFRIPCHARTIELPAGITGDQPGAKEETQADAARRELLEETGWWAEDMRALTTGPASAGLTSEQVTFFLATNLQQRGTGGGVGHEEIIVHQVPLVAVDGWLRAAEFRGALVDPKVYAGLYFLRTVG